MTHISKASILQLSEYNFFFLRGFGFMVFNATFNNISVISWLPVLLVDKTTDLSQVFDKLYHILLQCGKPFFSNTRQNGEWTETITRQDEKELAMFGE